VIASVENQQPSNHFRYGKYAGQRSLTVTGLTQNAGSEKKEPSSGSYNYIDVMKELKKKKSNVTKKRLIYKSVIKSILSKTFLGKMLMNSNSY
jgi:hypothetical protein